MIEKEDNVNLAMLEHVGGNGIRSMSFRFAILYGCIAYTTRCKLAGTDKKSRFFPNNMTLHSLELDRKKVSVPPFFVSDLLYHLPICYPPNRHYLVFLIQVP